MGIGIRTAASNLFWRIGSARPFPSRDIPRNLGPVADYDPDTVLSRIDHYNQGREPIEVIGWDSPKGLAIRKGSHNTLWQLNRRHLIGQLAAVRRTSTGSSVRERYDGTYDDIDPLDGWIGRRPTYYRVGEGAILHMSANLSYPVILEKVAEIIAHLGARSVCEIGCGTGTNLFFLASRLADTRFSGFELTAGGVACARRAKDRAIGETPYGRLFRIEPASLPAIRAVDVRQGSAFGLPCDDERFDLVVTVNAVEQMAERWKTAIREIRRVTRRHVIFYEYFRDYGTVDAFARNWIVNYFRRSVADVEGLGIRCLAVLRGFPTNVPYGPVMFIGEKV